MALITRLVVPEFQELPMKRIVYLMALRAESLGNRGMDVLFHEPSLTVAVETQGRSFADKELPQVCLVRSVAEEAHADLYRRMVSHPLFPG